MMRISGFEVLPAVGKSNVDVTAGLRKAGILIRCYGNNVGFKDVIRFSIARAQDTDRLMRGLLSASAGGGQVRFVRDVSISLCFWCHGF